MIYTNNKKFTKKSQSELLGFAIVVLLVAVGMLFVIGFIVLNEKTDTRAPYLYKQMATNLNDALLETTTTCRNLNVRDLYMNCMDNDREMCPASDDSTLNPDSVTACTYLQTFIENRFKSTPSKLGTLNDLGYYYQYSYRYNAVNAPANWSTRSSPPPTGFGSCKKERSTLLLSGSKQLLIYLDIFYDC
jgi:hypothetical protein